MNIMRKNGFTLVELLVIIAILVSLVSLLSPALSKTILQSINMNCVDNMKQHGAALHMYLSDNDDTFPLLHYDSNGNGVIDPIEEYTTGVYYQLGGYLGSGTGVYECPGFDPGGYGAKDRLTITTIDSSATEITAFQSYEFNSFRPLDVPGSFANPQGIQSGLIKTGYSLSLSKVDFDTIVAVDYTRAWGTNGGQTTANINASDALRGIVLGNHANKGASALHFDGTAAFISADTWMFDDRYYFNTTVLGWTDSDFEGTKKIYDNNKRFMMANLRPAGSRWNWGKEGCGAKIRYLKLV